MADAFKMDFSAVEKELNELAISLPRILRRSERDVRKLAEFLLERMRQNAPILEGDLREGLFFEITIEANAITIDFGGVQPYTLMRHEGVYELGPVSSVQPGTPEGGVGRKFMTRVLDKWDEQISDVIVQAVLDAMDAELKG